jgi:ABC-type dipeptide/oligopeptide/nickel transport system permease subunit
MMKKNISLILGIILVFIIIGIWVLSFVHMPYNPNEMNISNRFLRPGFDSDYILGTDNFGRDILSRIMYGSRNVLLVALVSVTLGSLVGIFLGALAAILKGLTEKIIMRIMDGLMAFPGILLAMMLVAVLERGIKGSIAAISIFMVPVFSRLVYSMILDTENLLYIKAAKSYGSSKGQIFFKHYIPAMLPRLVTQFSSSMGSAVMIETSLSFLGLGIQPPFASWGLMLSEARQFFLVTLIFLIIGKKYDTIYSNAKIISKPNFQFVKDIIKVGFPPCVQVGIHALISIIVTRILSVFGPMAIAVQSIGSQIESVTWMTTEGFSAAISAFVGQNYGAGKIKRIKEGYKKGIQIVGGIGLFATILLIFAAEPLFTIFTPDDLLAIKEGIVYLRILGLSQFLMAIEIGTTGAFNGLGKTIYPTANGIVLNVLRIPAALALSKTALGLSGVWWAISISSNLKGLVLFVLFYFYRKHFEEINKRLG